MGLKFNLMRAEKTKLQISTQKKQNSNGSTSSTSCQYFTDKAALRFLFAFTLISGLVLLSIKRGTKRQFLENICSEDDLRTRIFGIFVVKFLACLPPLGFSNI